MGAQFRVEPGQPHQLPGVELVRLPALGVDEPQFAGVDYHHSPRERILRADD